MGQLEEGEREVRMGTVPVFINTRDRYSTTKRLANQVAATDNAVPIIVDNASTWSPLVDWLAGCQYEVVRVGENAGHHAPWRFIQSKAEFEKKWGQSFYVVTDCDLDIGDVPSDFLDVLKEPFSWTEGIIKSGLSLRIDDLPEWQSSVLEWESRWWAKPVHGGRFFDALVDTTFCMFDSSTPHEFCKKVVGVKSVRSAPPYSARHMPWYLDSENLDDENKYYFEHANSSASWRPAGKALESRFAK